MQTVGPKGHVEIEEEISEKLGIKPGWWAFQRIVDEHSVEIYFVEPNHNRSLGGAAHDYVKEPFDPDRWHEIREEAWEQAAREKFGPPPGP